MANSSTTGHKSKKNRPLTPYFSLTLSLFLVIFGVIFLFWANRRFLVLPQRIDLSKQIDVSAQPDQFLKKPIKLYIPKLSKVLAISDGEVIDNRWIISETGASYLSSSVLPGKVGNSVIYGHNKTEILGGLPRVSAGDLIFVVLASGDFVKYQVFETKEVLPSQVEILESSDDSRLTIYTCSGFLDQARFVVVGRLVR